MPAKNKFYITTAIPYVNAAPHIGHALEFVQTDAIARWHKLFGDGVFLATGSDENSLKNVQAAEKEGITPGELCERNAAKFKELMDSMGLSYSAFVRSSLHYHAKSAQKLWKLCDKAGDIYRKKYKGLYCVGCEAFYAESELSNGLCPEHLKKPDVVEEENYFFRLSRYAKKLEKLIESDGLKIVPKSRKNEVLSFIKSGLEDFSISRSRARAEGWGVPVPSDGGQIMYVWFDALNIYQTAVGFDRDAKSYKKWWPADCHVIGKGIMRFHAVYWPAILLSAGLKLPKSLFVHGYITVNGQKMSKSLGNVVDPTLLINKYGADALRFFMLREISPFEDGDFSERALIQRSNSELASNYSNLLYRITSFIGANFNGKVPPGKLGNEEKGVDKIFSVRTEEAKKLMEERKLNEVLDKIMSLCTELNRYFQQAKPWENPKGSADALHFAANKMRDISILLWPFIPFASEKALKSLGAKRDVKTIGTFVSGNSVEPLKLFIPIEDGGKVKSMPADNKDTIEAKNGMIPLKEFQKLDLRTATVEDVKEHPDAQKLYILTVNLGSEKRQIVAGIKGFYTPEELKGKQVIIAANLEPAKIRGVESQGMLLAAGSEASLLVTLKKIKNGEKIR